MIKKAKSKLMNGICSYLPAEGGNVGMMVAIALVPLIIVIGAAVDHSRLTSDKEKAQAATDSAALSVAAAYYGDFNIANAGATGQSFSALNLKTDEDTDEYSIRTQINSEGQPDGTLLIETSISGTTDHAFLGIINNPSTDWIVTSQAQVTRPPKTEIMLVLDVSHSMFGSKLESLKTAATQFIDDLQPYNAADSHIAVTLIPFGENVNFGQEANIWLNPSNGLDFADSFAGCFGFESDLIHQNANFAPNQMVAVQQGIKQNRPLCPSDNSKALLFSTNGEAIKTSISKMDTSWGTNTNNGLLWAERLLSNQWRSQAYFSTTPSKYVFSDTEKVVVLLTDGQITTTDADQNGQVLQQLNQADELERFKAHCDAFAELPNSSVFTIGYNVPAGATSDALAACASGGGSYFDAGLNDLTNVFSSIKHSLQPIRIIK